MAMTPTERMRAYRARQATGERPVRYRRPRDRRSRPQRWRDAVQTLTDLQAEYQKWLDSIPDHLQNSPTAERLQQICELELDEIGSVELPKGYGRD